MLSVELKFDLFLYYTAWICWHFNFAINVWDHKLLWYFISKLWTLYNFCHAGCWHILLWIKKKNVLPEACKMICLCVHNILIQQNFTLILELLHWTLHQQSSQQKHDYWFARYPQIILFLMIPVGSVEN